VLGANDGAVSTAGLNPRRWGTRPPMGSTPCHAASGKAAPGGPRSRELESRPAVTVRE